jgi:hypothetical protein
MANNNWWSNYNPRRGKGLPIGQGKPGSLWSGGTVQWSSGRFPAPTCKYWVELRSPSAAGRSGTIWKSLQSRITFPHVLQRRLAWFAFIGVAFGTVMGAMPSALTSTAGMAVALAGTSISDAGAFSKIGLCGAVCEPTSRRLVCTTDAPVILLKRAFRTLHR